LSKFPIIILTGKEKALFLNSVCLTKNQSNQICFWSARKLQRFLPDVSFIRLGKLITEYQVGRDLQDQLGPTFPGISTVWTRWPSTLSSWSL